MYFNEWFARKQKVKMSSWIYFRILPECSKHAVLTRCWNKFSMTKKVGSLQVQITPKVTFVALFTCFLHIIALKIYCWVENPTYKIFYSFFALNRSIFAQISQNRSGFSPTPFIFLFLSGWNPTYWLSLIIFGKLNKKVILFLSRKTMAFFN